MSLGMETIRTVDTDWVLAELNTFVEMTKLYRPPDPPGIAILGDSRRTIAVKSAIITSAQVVEQILDRVLQRWRSDIGADDTGRWQQHREVAIRSIALIQRQSEINENLGDSVPRLDAGQMRLRSRRAPNRFGNPDISRKPHGSRPSRSTQKLRTKSATVELAETKLFQQVFRAEPGTSQVPLLRHHWTTMAA